MRPDRIGDILDLAWSARQLDLLFNPMFVGEAGLGKSASIQQWVKRMDEKYRDSGGFGFVDARLAYMEGPDFVGYPYEYTDEDGVRRMGHALPHFWPTKGRGLILLEEPNRGNTMVMNCCMQLLTDRQVGPSYRVPPGWIIAGAMNPEGAKYDVNAMDTALANRFEMFSVDFDFNTFVSYIEKAGWHPKVVQHIKSGQWVYKTPDAISKDGQYISPRTWDKLNAAEHSGVSDNPGKQALHYIVCQAVLGKHEGNIYWKSCWDDAPVTAQDILVDLSKCIDKLKKQSESGDNYAGDKIAVTVNSIVEHYGGWYEGRKNQDGSDWPHEADTIDEQAMVAIAMIIPADQAVNLIKNCGYKTHKGQVKSYLMEFNRRNPKCVAIMRDNIKIDRAINNS
jgi:hypothetical protein